MRNLDFRLFDGWTVWSGGVWIPFSDDVFRVFLPFSLRAGLHPLTSRMVTVLSFRQRQGRGLSLGAVCSLWGMESSLVLCCIECSIMLGQECIYYNCAAVFWLIVLPFVRCTIRRHYIAITHFVVVNGRGTESLIDRVFVFIKESRSVVLVQSCFCVSFGSSVTGGKRWQLPWIESVLLMVLRLPSPSGMGLIVK